MYKSYYESFLGKIILISDGNVLIYLGFDDFYLQVFRDEDLTQNDDLDIFKKVKMWLDSYFRGENPLIPSVDFEFSGSEYKCKILRILSEIPYGKTVSYEEVANIYYEKTHKKTSARAVGRAIHGNPISIIIPCHRVVGKDGNLTGYAYGIDRKIKLLKLENVDMSGFYMPKK